MICQANMIRYRRKRRTMDIINSILHLTCIVVNAACIAVSLFIIGFLTFA